MTYFLHPEHYSPLTTGAPGHALGCAIERLLPDELFGEVMQGMVDSAWLRERAETIQASGGPDSNAKAAALLEAADAADGAATSGSPDAAP